MAGRAEIKCIGPSSHLADRKTASQRAINLRMSLVEGLGEDKPVVLESVPGLLLLADVSDTIRGTYNTGSRWFVAAGGTLYEVTTGGALTTRGTLAATAAGFVSMKHGRNQLVIVDGTNGYVLNLTTNAFSDITDPDWRGSDWVDELDGYFIFVAPGTEQFYISAIDDASSFDALDFSSADRLPDTIIAHRVRKGELFLIGSRSIEVWIDSGDVDFPLVRYNSTPIDVGTVGARAVCVTSEALVWVGQTDRGLGYVYAMSGHSETRISTQAVEEAIGASTNIALCSVWTYHDQGKEFVGVNAPGMETTWVYDFSTRQWHEQAELVSGAWVPMRIDQVTAVGGRHYATADSSIYLIDRDTYAIGSAPLVRERTWPHLMAPSMEPISYRGLEIACTTGSVTAGTITLEISNDGGYVFHTPLLRSLGAIGRRMQRVRWLPLGSARDRVFRLRCSDAVPLTIHAAAVDA